MARLSAAAEVRLLEASEQQLMEELAQYRKAMKNLQQMIRRESQSVNDRLHEDVYLVAALVYTLSGTVDLAVLYLKWKAASLQSVPAPVGPELDLATATEVVVNLLPVIPQLVAIPHLLRSAVLWMAEFATYHFIFTVNRRGIAASSNDVREFFCTSIPLPQRHLVQDLLDELQDNPAYQKSWSRGFRRRWRIRYKIMHLGHELSEAVISQRVLWFLKWIQKWVPFWCPFLGPWPPIIIENLSQGSKSGHLFGAHFWCRFLIFSCLVC